jgi:hypothetical protein
MRVARLFGAVLVVCLSASVILEPAASAIPSYKFPITLKTFTGSSGTTLFRGSSPSESKLITCAHDQLAGTITTEEAFVAKFHFLNCTITANGAGPCEINSVGAASGLIVTALLRGLLALLHSPASGAAVLLEADTGHEWTTLAATNTPCLTPEVALQGSVAGLYSPTGKRQTTAKINFSWTGAPSTLKQEVTEVLTSAGSVKPKLELFGSELLTVESAESLTYAEAVEVT